MKIKDIFRERGFHVFLTILGENKNWKRDCHVFLRISVREIQK